MWRILLFLALGALGANAQAGSLPAEPYYFLVHDKGIANADDEAERWDRANRSKLFVMQFVLEGGKPVDVRVAQWYNTRYGGREGNKVRRGDQRTPEGLYRITEVESQGWRSWKKYGPWSFRLDYPNRSDRRNRRTGSGVLIHGGRNLYTLGCIRVLDCETCEGFSALGELEREYVGAGTPVISARYVPEQLRGRIGQLLGRQAAEYYARILMSDLENEEVVDLVAAYYVPPPPAPAPPPLAKLTVTTNVAADVLLNGTHRGLATPAGLTMELPPGVDYLIEVSSLGFLPVERALAIESGAKDTVAVTLVAKAPPPPEPLPVTTMLRPRWTTAGARTLFRVGYVQLRSSGTGLTVASPAAARPGAVPRVSNIPLHGFQVGVSTMSKPFALQGGVFMASNGFASPISASPGAFGLYAQAGYVAPNYHRFAPYGGIGYDLKWVDLVDDKGLRADRKFRPGAYWTAGIEFMDRYYVGYRSSLTPSRTASSMVTFGIDWQLADVLR